MKTQKVKLYDFYTLDLDLNGKINQETGSKIVTGILDEKLSVIAKYWLSQLNEIVRAEVKLLDAQRDDLIKKYGKENEDGSVSLQQAITEKDASGVEITKINPKFLEFNDEFTKFLNEEKEIQYTPIKLADLSGLATDRTYETLFKFVDAA